MQKFTTSLATFAVVLVQVFGAFAGLSLASADKALAGGGGLPAKINSYSVTENSNGTYYINYCTDVEGYLTVGVYQAVGTTSSKKVAIIADSMRTMAQCSYVIWDGNYGDQNEIGVNGRKTADGQYFYGITLDGEYPYSYGTDYKADWFTIGSTSNDVITRPDNTNNNNTHTDNTDNTDTTSTVKIVDVSVKNKSFDPWDNQEAKLTFTLNTSAKVTLTIKDEDNNTVVTLIDNESYKKGDYTAKWDGTDEFGDTVDQGNYTYVLKVTSGSDKDSEKGSLKVKKGAQNDTTNSPRLKDVFVTKDSFDPNANESTYIVYTLTAQSDVMVDIYNANGKKISNLEDDSNKAAGTYSVKWDGEEANNGTYTYRVYAENSEGKDSKEGTITLADDTKSSGKPNVYKDVANEGIFTPSQGDLTIKFRLDKDADVTVEIRDGNMVLGTIINDQSLLEGVNSVKWDGSDKYGEALEEGLYQYKILASNNKGKDVETGTFMIEGSTKYKYADSCGSFTDMISSEQYCEAIKWAADSGIFTGYNDGSFRPEKSLTRVEALKVILESQHVQIESAKGQNLGFYDVNGYDWYTSYLKTALDLGIVHGYSDGSFRPNQTISRVEALAMLLNTAEVASNVVVPTNTYGQPYYDTINDKNTKWYMSYVWFAKENNLTDNSYYFYPDSNMTRGEMADMLYRLYKAGF